MKKLALLALSVACLTGIASAGVVDLSYSGMGSHEIVGFRDSAGAWSWNRQVYAGLINFTVNEVAHSGFCLTPDRQMLGSWEATISQHTDQIGWLINRGMESNHAGFSDAVWKASAQIAIWEYVVSHDAINSALGNGTNEYDWCGIYWSNSIQDCLETNFYYSGVVQQLGDGNSYMVSKFDETKFGAASYTRYSAIKDSSGRFSQDLGEKNVPGPAAAVPFALGFFAAMKRRRK